MKKNYIALLLTTTFIVGCGGGSPSNSTSGSTTSGANTSASTLNSKAIIEKAKTIEEAIALPEVKAKIESLTPAWNAIKDVKATDKDTMTSAQRYNYIKNWKDFFQGVYDISDLLQGVQIKAIGEPGQMPDVNTASWQQMAQYFDGFYQKSEKLKTMPDLTLDKDVAKLIGFKSDLALQPDDFWTENPQPGSEEERINNEINRVFRQHGSDERNFYISLQNGGLSLRVKINQFVEGKLSGFDQLAPIKEALNREGFIGYPFSEDQPALGLVSEVAQNALRKDNFKLYEVVDGVPIISGKAGALGNAIQQSKIIDHSTESDQFYRAEKAIITGMMQTKKFNGLFDYLRDKKVTVGTKVDLIPFPAAEYDALIAADQQLAAGISPSTMGRSARNGTAGVDGSQLQVNGVSAGKVEMELPISINLKGKIDGSKTTAGTSGSFAYKMGNTVLGVVHAYANKGEGFEAGSHQSETSVAVSQSIGTAFIEGQVGYIGTHDVHNANLTGTRYQLSVGFDTETVSPFAQVAYRDFGSQSDTVAYVGAELTANRLEADTHSLDVNLTAKVGVNSKTELVGSFECSTTLNLNSGISFKTHLTLGTVEGSTVGLTANISR